MARGEQVLRHWNLLRTLQTRGAGVTLRELADEFEVSERTIQRDFETLDELGIPIEHDEDDYGKRFWRLPHDFFRSGPLVISVTEAISLHLAGQFMSPLAGTHLAVGFDTVLEKVRSLLPSRALEHFGQLDQTVYVRRTAHTDYAQHADTIRTLTEAARGSRSVELSYHSLWRKAEYATRYDPYGLVYYDGDLFVVGHSHKAGAIRILKVPRIQAAELTDASFERPVGFSLEHHFRGTFGIVHSGGRVTEVVVRFTGPAAALVEERLWHESQQLERLEPEQTLFDDEPGDGVASDARDGGSLVATFKLSDFVEFKRWLKGFGADAEVLRPAELRREMRTELEEALNLYGGTRT